MPCLEGAASHEDWHPTRAALLKIGAEMTARVRAREARAVAQMPDAELVAYGIRMRRLKATAASSDWPEWAVELVGEWIEGAEKEWRWRQQAAKLGADPVVRSPGTWPERVERLHREVDLVKLIAYEVGDIRMVTPGRWQCRCPLHDDRHPSLDIDVNRGLWICRACHVGGDAIRYVELTRGCSFADAVAYLEERSGLEPIAPARRLVDMT